MSDVVALILMVGITAYALFGGADFGAGFWDLTAGGAERGRTPRSVITHSIGPVWEANHVWLIFCLVVLWTAFSRGVRVDHAHALRAVVDRGARHRVPRLVVRVPQGGHAHVEPAQLRCRVRDVVGDRAVLHGRGRRCDRVGPCARGRQGRRPVVELDQPHVDPRRRARGHRVRVPRRRLHGVGRQASRRPRTWSSTSVGARSSSAIVTGVVALAGIFVLHDDAVYVFHGLTSRALPLVILSALCGIGSMVLLLRSSQTGARLLAMGAVATVVLGWGVAQYPYILPTSMKLSAAAAPDADVVVGGHRVRDRGVRDPAVARPALLPRPARPARRTRGRARPRRRRVTAVDRLRPVPVSAAPRSSATSAPDAGRSARRAAPRTRYRSGGSTSTAMTVTR